MILVGLLHKKRWNDYGTVIKILSEMAFRINCGIRVEEINNNDTVNTIKERLKNIHKNSTIRGIMIFGDDIPVPKIWRKTGVDDQGIADMIYGNFTIPWIDSDKDGYFDEEEFPIDYTQDVWVCRWIPDSINYSEFPLAFLFGKKTFTSKLIHWYGKLLTKKSLRKPLESAITIVDTTGGAFATYPNSIQENVKVFYGEIINEWIAPYQATASLGNEKTRKYWCEQNIGMIFFKGHSTSLGIGDYKGYQVFDNAKSDCGPTLFIAMGCEVGEWNKPLGNPFTYKGFAGNLLNPKCRFNSTITVLASGLIQFGASQDLRIGHSNKPPIKGMSLFDFMALDQCLGDSVKNWIQFGVNYYKHSSSIAFVGMNILGDGSLINK